MPGIQCAGLSRSAAMLDPSSIYASHDRNNALRSSMTTNAVIRVHQHGGPECLRLDELPLESLQPDQLLIEVQAAGVNFFDTQLRSGLYKQPLPIALGNEGAGVVRE